MEQYSPYSGLKIFHHTERIAGLAKGERVAPVYVRIKPTNVCNQNCFYCGYANDKVFGGRKLDRRESIPWERMEKILLEMSEMGIKAVTFSGGGEPLCYHSIVKTLKLVEDLGMDFSIITNGQALEGEAAGRLKHAKWVRVSFDAADACTYEGMRGVKSYDRVVQNVREFAQIKSPDCTLGVNCVVSKQNAQEVYGICELVKNLGVDNVKLSPMLVKGNEADYHETIKDDVYRQILRAKQELVNGTFRIVDKYTDDLGFEKDFRKPYHKCLIQELFTVIAADSKVYRCHQRAYMEAGEIGDLGKNTFKEIWYSQSSIEKARGFDPCEECRFRCAFDERNMLLNDFMSIDRNHVNFI